jgi:hypothetical protein
LLNSHRQQSSHLCCAMLYGCVTYKPGAKGCQPKNGFCIYNSCAAQELNYWSTSPCLGLSSHVQGAQSKVGPRKAPITGIGMSREELARYAARRQAQVGGIATSSQGLICTVRVWCLGQTPAHLAGIVLLSASVLLPCTCCAPVGTPDLDPGRAGLILGMHTALLLPKPLTF